MFTAWRSHLPVLLTLLLRFVEMLSQFKFPLMFKTSSLHLTSIPIVMFNMETTCIGKHGGFLSGGWKHSSRLIPWEDASIVTALKLSIAKHLLHVWTAVTGYLVAAAVGVVVPGDHCSGQVTRGEPATGVTLPLGLWSLLGCTRHRATPTTTLIFHGSFTLHWHFSQISNIKNPHFLAECGYEGLNEATSQSPATVWCLIAGCRVR